MSECQLYSAELWEEGGPTRQEAHVSWGPSLFFLLLSLAGARGGGEEHGGKGIPEGAPHTKEQEWQGLEGNGAQMMEAMSAGFRSETLLDR